MPLATGFAGSEYFNRTSDILNCYSNHTFTYWIFPIDDDQSNSAHLSWNLDEFTCRNTTGTWRSYVNQVGAGSVSITYNTWQFVHGIRASSTDWQIWVDNVRVANRNTDVSAISTPDRMDLGRWGTGEYFNGYLWNFIAWDAALTSEQAYSQRLRFYPITHGNLWGHFPLQPGSDRAKDRSGRVSDWNTGGSFSDQAAPSVSYGYPIYVVQYGSGATRYEQSVGGTLAPAGVLARQTNALRAGALTPSGALWQQTSTLKSGALTPTGALTRQGQKVAAGSLDPVGSLGRQTQKVMAGALASAGTLTKHTARSLAGSLTPAGALAMAKTVLLSLAGAVAPAGALIRLTAIAPSGGLAPIGAITKQTLTALSGAVAPSGALSVVRTVLFAVSGVLTSSGALSRQTMTGLAGTVAPAGALIKRTSKSLIGALSQAGTVTAVRTVLISLAGLLAPTGALTKQAAHGLVGALASAGTLTKRTARSLAGSLTPAGALDAVQSAGTAVIRKVISLAGMFGRVTSLLGSFTSSHGLGGSDDNDIDLDGSV